MGNSEPVKKKVPIIRVALRTYLVYFFMLVLVAIILLMVYQPWRIRQEIFDFDNFVQLVNHGKVSAVGIDTRNHKIGGILKNKTEFSTVFPANYDIKRFVKGKVDRVVVDRSHTPENLFLLLIFVFVPLIIFLVVLLILKKRRKEE